MMSDYVRIDDGKPSRPPEPPAIKTDEPPAAAYSGRLGELIPIVLVNMLLSVLTLGIYRFWGKTKIRRYLWSRVSVMDEPLEYTGTGTELFLGFLIILCVLIPVTFVIGMLQFLVISHPLGPLAVQLVFGLLFFYLFYVAVYRAQRYRLSRMTWRGIRGAMEGSSVTYANKAMLYTLLTCVSLGLVYPYMQVALMRYRIENASFGRVNFAFSADARTLMKSWAICLVVSFIIAIAIYLPFGDQLAAEAQDLSSEPEFADLAEIYPYLITALIFLGILSVTTIWYQAVSIRHFVASTRFDTLTARSTLTARNIIQIYLPVFLFALLGVFITFGLTMTARGSELIPFVAIGFFFAYLFVPIVIVHRYFSKFSETLTLEGTISPEKLLQSQQEKPSTGEGLADALDIDAF